MKLYAFVFVLAVCLTQNVIAISRDWESKIESNQQQQINDIIDNASKLIQVEASTKGTAAAQACYKTARLSLKSLSQDGYSRVSSCISSANTAVEANLCSQQVALDMYKQGRKVSVNATVCINKA